MQSEEQQLRSALGQKLRARHFALLGSIYRHRTLRKVAEEMHLSQPAITKALKELEELVGTELFQRTAHGLIPTSTATVLESRGSSFLAELDKLAHEIVVVKQGFQGVFTVGIIKYISYGILSRAMEDVRSRGFDYQYVVRDGHTEMLVEMLLAHKVDCVIARLSHDHADQLQQEVLYTQRAALVASTAFPLSKKAALKLADLNRARWLLSPRGTPIRRAVEETFIREGCVVPIPHLETTSVGMLRATLERDNAAVTILPVELANELAKDAHFQILPVELNMALPPVSLLTRRNENKERGLEMLVQAIRDAARQTR